jgi:hypothetical protein
VAYAASDGGKCYVVVDGKEGKPYGRDPEDQMLFDSAKDLHYLVRRFSTNGDNSYDLYLVEETVY